MVRLKHYLIPSGTWLKTSQFHYGSIKTNQVPTWAYFFNRSQFHYGSIKTFLGGKQVLKYVGSQFHYGSIKTHWG